MKILAVCSGRENGNSFKMIKEAMANAISENVTIDFIHLGKMEMKFCDGCLSCDKTGKCHLDDDMKKVINMIDDYSGFIFSTPARWSLLSGDLKVFFDRLNPLASSNRLCGKKTVVFVVGQSESNDSISIKRTLQSVKYFCENAGIETVGSVLVTDCLEPSDILSQKNKLKRCKLLLKKLISMVEV
jgi:multimeric flavodoxin WrbA